MSFLHGTTNHGGRHASQSQRRPRALASSCQLASMALVSTEGIASQAARHGDSKTGNSSLAAAGPASSSLTKRQQAKLTTEEGSLSSWHTALVSVLGKAQQTRNKLPADTTASDHLPEWHDQAIDSTTAQQVRTAIAMLNITSPARATSTATPIQPAVSDLPIRKPKPRATTHPPTHQPSRPVWPKPTANEGPRFDLPIKARAISATNLDTSHQSVARDNDTTSNRPNPIATQAAIRRLGSTNQSARPPSAACQLAC